MEGAVDVLFICLHGSAKSVIAAEHLRRLAEARGLLISAASAGVEPDVAIPPHVVAGLGAEQIDVSAMRPRQVNSDILANALRVISFGCDVSALGASASTIVRWNDVPAVSDGYAEARDAIVCRLQQLLEEIAAHESPVPNG